MSEIEIRYAKEQERSDHEHHVPTAGAMIGHITSNLAVHALKIEQAALFAKGPAALFLDQYGRAWIQKELAFGMISIVPCMPKQIWCQRPARSCLSTAC